MNQKERKPSVPCIPHLSRLGLSLFLLLCLMSTRFALGQTNGILREVWLNIGGGNAVADLTSHASFPDNPSFEEVLTDAFEAPSDVYDGYGQRLQALITAPETGNYVFWIASDDNSALYLSTDDNPVNKQLRAQVPVWTSSREWSKYPEQQQSAPIFLSAGQQYYIEALMKEGNGGDNLAVRWRLPSGLIEEPIPASRCVPYGLGPPVITIQPAHTMVIEGGTATFSVTLARTIGATFQWKRNGTNIPGATASAYVISPVALNDNGSTFQCAITNSYGWTNSITATLTVLPDTTRPTLVSAVNLGDNTLVTLLYSEPVDPATATDASNYTLDLGANVLAARFAGDDRTIVLETSPLSPGLTYTVTVNNVSDRAATPNIILTDSQRTFSLSATPLSMDYIKGRREPPGPSSRSTGLVITEIMYHPADRVDGRNLEFIELFNSEAQPVSLEGYRISGSVEYTFPPGTTLAARSYRVVAAAPADMQAVYGIANVSGPFANSLPNSSGIIRLLNRLGAVMLEVEYSDDPPWPVAADGAGHSLVLARPSFGEADVRAWAASDLVGGSPAAQDTLAPDPYRTIVINEVLAHSDPPAQDFIELYNHGTIAVNLAGCTLSDRPDVNKFTIPVGTIISPGGFVMFNETQLGFALSTLGEDIFLRDPAGTRVVDALRFGAQENGISFGRTPDGAPEFQELSSVTPGISNTKPLSREVVINEIMFGPIAGDLDEFIELRNRSAEPVDVSGWRFTSGIDFTFPTNTTIPANGYLLVARNVSRLLTNYPNLNTANVVGDFSGSLANGGERVALAKLDFTVTTENNVAVTNAMYVEVDEVTYKDGGRWGRWADRGGSSLELRDSRSDNRRAPNWANSDESAKAGWVTIEHTGVLDLGSGASDELQVMLLGSGECLLDNLEVFAAGGPNRVPNGTFESGLDAWVIQGNHVHSTLRTNEGFAGSRSLHLRASGGGDNGANRAKIKLTSGFSNGQTVTIRARARWLTGHTNLLLRLKGNYLEVVESIAPPPRGGTPGAVNSRELANAGPAVYDVTHWPVLPIGGQSVQVVARVDDPDGLANLQLVYRVDPSTNVNVVSMVYHGAGFFSGTIPGQSSGTLVAFHIRATDAHPTAPATALFPDDAPNRECLVRFGDATPAGTFGIYRLWMTQKNINAWTAREKLSNEELDSTFVYGNFRAVYNAGGRYRGSPWIRPGYSTPTGNPCSYVWSTPKDDALLGEDEFNLDSLEPGRDDTRQREKAAFWIAEQLGVPFSYQRYVHIYVNGVKRGDIYTDSQQPNSDYLRSWFPDDERGEIFKTDDWFEFNDSVAQEFNREATLQNFTTTGGVKKKARYRWNWEKKSNRGLDDDYTRLFELVDAVNTPGTDAYTSAVEAVVDVEEWMRVFAVRHIAGDWDGYGYRRGKNQFAYKNADDRWKLLLWDLDFSLGAQTGDAPEHDLFETSDPVIQRMYQHPPFRRVYLRALYDAANGPLLSSRVEPMLDATHAALIGNGVAAAAPAPVKDWISQRRAYILQELDNSAASFEFTINGGNNFSTTENFVTLSGTAPVQVKTIKINGVAYSATWTSTTGWSIQYALAPGANALVLQAFDTAGNQIAGLSDNITITFNGAIELPEDSLVINEIMFNPAVPNADYVEIYNRASNTAFDLTGYRLSGVDFDFPEGTILPAGGYVLAVKDPGVFLAAFGAGHPVAGSYLGTLDNGGETLRLIRRGATPEQDLLIDQVTYDDDPPWPVLADGFGPSLQLIDSAQDNNRVANWAAIPGGGGNQTNTLISITDVWKYNQSGVDLGTAWRQTNYNDISWPSGAALLYVENSSLPAPKNTQLTIGRTTYYFRKTFNYSGDPSRTTLYARFIVDDGAAVYLNGTNVLSLGMGGGFINYNTFASRTIDNATYEGPFVLSAASLVEGINVIAVEVHQNSSGSTDVAFGMTLDAVQAPIQAYTPGARNSVATNLPPLPPLWLNELQAQNLSGPQDGFGERDPWVELYNADTNAISLENFFLTDNYGNLTRWAFPPGATLNAGEFKLVWLDAQPGQTGAGEWHADFMIASPAGSVALVQVANNHTSIVDYLNYNLPIGDRSYGAYPDGTPAQRTRFYFATPAAPNTNSYPEVPVSINEWMADNSSTISDSLDGKFSDWFELYNSGTDPVDLSGFTLTDNLGNPNKWTIPDGVIIQPGEFLLVWADSEPDQNGQGPHLHADFALSLGGEAIGLFAPNGLPVATITFGPQTSDVSEGVWPDGGVNRYFMTTPTPGAANQILNPPNSSPVLAPIPDVAILAGQTWSATNSAFDPDLPVQTLTFELVEAPSFMGIDPASGVITWRPRIAQSGSTNPVVVRVFDNGTPSLEDTTSFTAVVLKPAAPYLSSLSISNGHFSLVVSGDTGADYIIERSPSLSPANWVGVFTNYSPVLPFTWSVPVPPDGENALYRVRLAP